MISLRSENKAFVENRKWREKTFEKQEKTVPRNINFAKQNTILKTLAYY